MSGVLERLTVGLKIWNKDIYGHINVRKRKLVHELNKTQKEIEQVTLEVLVSKELRIREELEEVLNHEELLWKQKSRCDWLNLGDRNTNFFVTVRYSGGKSTALMVFVAKMVFRSITQMTYRQKL